VIALPNRLPLIYTGNFGSYNERMCYYNSGTCSNSNGTVVVAPGNPSLALMCDVLTVGVNTNWSAPLGWSSTLGGMDKPLSGDNAGLYFYLVCNTLTGDLALMASEDGTYRIALPAGWEMVRQMHFSCKYKLNHGPNWNGLPDTFQAIDNSAVLLPGSGEDPAYQVLPPSKSGPNPQVLSLKDWVVNDARTVMLFCRVSNQGGGPGTAYIYRSFVSRYPTPVGQVNNGWDNSYFDFKCKLDSAGNLKWWTLGDATLALYLWGYEFDDPT